MMSQATKKAFGLTIISLIVGAVSGSFLVSRDKVPMTPLSPRFSVRSPDQVPSIVVGQLIEDSKAIAAPQYSQWDHRLVQLWKARVRVEHVLKGEDQPAEIDVFYFPDMGPGGGPWGRVTELPAGQSEIFFLQPDNGKLRTVCDGWDACMIWVRTGEHRSYQVNPAVDVEDAVLELQLSRGDRTTDQQMIDAINHPADPWGGSSALHALRKLVNVEHSPVVKTLAVDRLRHIEALEKQTSDAIASRLDHCEDK